MTLRQSFELRGKINRDEDVLMERFLNLTRPPMTGRIIAITIPK